MIENIIDYFNSNQNHFYQKITTYQNTRQLVHQHCQVEDFTKINSQFGEDTTIRNFEFFPEYNSCSFVINGEEYELIPTTQPQDKWGNTIKKDSHFQCSADDDCRWIHYSNENCSELNPDFFDLYEELYSHSQISEDDFYIWFLDNYKNYNFISEVVHPDLCGEFDCKVKYITTNKHFNSVEWQELFKDFINFIENN